jgi:large subunit ribosomal protein L13
MKITRSIKKSEINKNWYIVDAKGVRLGKLATNVASILLGKAKIDRADNLANGDAVIVINAANVDVHLSKLNTKMYSRHSGYIGGLKQKSLGELLESKPEFVIENAVLGMLPKSKMGRQLYKNLFVYANDKHPHVAQNPINIEIK